MAVKQDGLLEINGAIERAAHKLFAAVTLTQAYFNGDVGEAAARAAVKQALAAATLPVPIETPH